MYTEPNLHSRNLKFVSLMFILYWVLGLKAVDGSIRLLVINYEISNPSALTWVAHLLLLYFAWRFYLNSRRQIRSGFHKSFGYHQFSNKKNSYMYKSLRDKATKNYIENYKSQFEKEREDLADKKSIVGFNNSNFSANPIKFNYERNKLTLSYQVQYEGEKLPGNDFKNFEIVYGWRDWVWLKLWKFLCFIVGKEEAPDYLLPWILFFLALACSLMLRLGITVHDIC